jgi:hypothetical protein
LSADGKTATIYNGETFTDADKAKQSYDEFEDKVKKLGNDNQGSIGKSKAVPVIF